MPGYFRVRLTALSMKSKGEAVHTSGNHTVRVQVSVIRKFSGLPLSVSSLANMIRVPEHLKRSALSQFAERHKQQKSSRNARKEDINSSEGLTPKRIFGFWHGQCSFDFAQGQAVPCKRL